MFKEIITQIPKWLFPMAIISIVLTIFVIWQKQLQFHFDGWTFRITEQIDAQAHRKYCPNPDSIEKHGFCIWHIGEYNKTFFEAAKACKTLGARLCSLNEVSAAQAAGAEWCSAGWVSNRNENGSKAFIAYPMQSNNTASCGKAFFPHSLQELNTNWGANCCL